jgi:hypothetical protein
MLCISSAMFNDRPIDSEILDGRTGRQTGSIFREAKRATTVWEQARRADWYPITWRTSQLSSADKRFCSSFAYSESCLLNYVTLFRTQLSLTITERVLKGNEIARSSLNWIQFRPAILLLIVATFHWLAARWHCSQKSYSGFSVSNHRRYEMVCIKYCAWKRRKNCIPVRQFLDVLPYVPCIEPSDKQCNYSSIYYVTNQPWFIQLAKKFLTFCWTQRFISLFTNAVMRSYPVLAEYSFILLHSFSKIRFNIILSYKPRPSSWYIPMFTDQNVCIAHCP